jgi:hypothetical protein
MELTHASFDKARFRVHNVGIVVRASHPRLFGPVSIHGWKIGAMGPLEDAVRKGAFRGP